MSRRTITPAAVVTFLASSTLAELLNNLVRTGVRFTSLTKVQGSTYSAVAVRLFGVDDSRGGVGQVALSAQLEMERNSARCSYFMEDVATERVARADAAADAEFEGEAAHEAACEKAAAEYLENRDSRGSDHYAEENEFFDGEYEVSYDAERRAEQLAAERLSGDWY